MGARVARSEDRVLDGRGHARGFGGPGRAVGREARAFVRLVCRDGPATFATPAENETAMNASGGAGGEQARIHAAEALHRLGRV